MSDFQALVESARVVKYEPGDTIVFRTPDRLSMEDAVRIRRTLGELFPGAQLAVVDSGADLEVQAA